MQPTGKQQAVQRTTTITGAWPATEPRQTPTERMAAARRRRLGAS